MHLVRVRLVGSHAAQDDIASGRSNNVFRDSVGSAFFWPSDEGAQEPGTRVLQGELEVKKALKLGFVFPRFSLRVRQSLCRPPLCQPNADVSVCRPPHSRVPCTVPGMTWAPPP